LTNKIKVFEILLFLIIPPNGGFVAPRFVFFKLFLNRIKFKVKSPLLRRYWIGEEGRWMNDE